jgi:hypothetical protein
MLLLVLDLFAVQNIFACLYFAIFCIISTYVALTIKEKKYLQNKRPDELRI